MDINRKSVIMKKILLVLLLIPTLAFSQFNWVKVGDSLELVNGSHHLFIGGVRLLGQNDSNLLYYNPWKINNLLSLKVAYGDSNSYYLRPWKIASLYQPKGNYLTSEVDPIFIADSSLFPKKTYLTSLLGYKLNNTDTTDDKLATHAYIRSLGLVAKSDFVIGMLSGNSTMEGTPSAIPFSTSATQWKPANNSAIYSQNISVDYTNNKMTISTGYSGLYLIYLMINMNSVQTTPPSYGTVTIYVNGSPQYLKIIAQINATNNNVVYSCSGVLTLFAGDIITVWEAQKTGSGGAARCYQYQLLVYRTNIY